MQGNSFWEDQEEAKKVIEQSKALKAWTVPYQDLKRRFSDVKALLPEVLSTKEEELLGDLRQELIYIDKTLSELEIRKMLSGEMDPMNCYLGINAGAGGTEACDWALMLCRMYQRWATRRGWKVEVVDTVDGEIAGIKNTTLKITGDFAYGYCKSERGVHRLVRISPFDSNAKRHTSFASVDVIPEINDDIQIEIKPDELRIDTYRASGAGGQHVNKTDSAIRITHLPTGLVVECQDERSQHKNRARAMSLLQAKLLDAEQTRQRQEQAQTRKNLVGTGDRSERIRTYNYPQGRVTDHRINLTLYKLPEIMEGALAQVIEPLRREHQAELLAGLEGS